MASTSASSTVAAELEPEMDLQEWLERFSERLNGRTNAVAKEVQQLVDRMDVVELSLKNTFNSFRGLSSSQFIENRVYDEDETEVISAGISRRDGKRISVPSESYEEDILPRYKDAVAIAWRAYQGRGRRLEETVVRAERLSSPGNLRLGERTHILPHIIGTEEFTRDVHCGLSGWSLSLKRRILTDFTEVTDLRRKSDDVRPRSDDSEFEIEEERDEEKVAGEGIRPRTSFEAGMSGRESDDSAYQDGGFEPAVSAAMDFKAQLEAALRNPSLPYDGGTLRDSESAFGNFGDNRYSLPSLADDALSDDAPRTISTLVDIIGKTMSGMGENKNQLGASISEASDSAVNIPPLPSGRLASEVLVQPTERESTTASSSSSQSDEDESTGLATRQEQSRQPFHSQAQSMLNEEFMQKFLNGGFSRQAEAGNPAQVRKISGLFGDEDNERGAVVTEERGLPYSSTGPTIPEGLLSQRPQLVNEPNAPGIQFQAPNMGPRLPSGEALVGNIASPAVTADENSHREFENTEREAQNESQPSALSSETQNTASVSEGSGWPKVVNPLPFRGGLFDDDEEEDEDNLFGASEPPKLESQPILRPWASKSSKNLFDDIVEIGADEEVTPRDLSEPAQIQSSKTSSILRESKQGPAESQRRPVESSSSEQSPKPSLNLKFTEPVGAEAVKSDRQTGSVTVLETPTQSMLAAAFMSSRPAAATGSDEDSWSSSDGECGSDNAGIGKLKDDADQQTESESVEDNADGRKNFQSKRVEPVTHAKSTASQLDSDHPNQSRSLLENLAVAELSVQREERDAASPNATSPRMPPPSSPRSSASKMPSSTDMETNLLLQPAGLDRSISDEIRSDDGNSSPWMSESEGLSQPIESALSSDAPSLLDTIETPISQSTNYADRTRASSTPGKSHPISEHAPRITKMIASEPVNEFGRLTGGRTFASLFEDDDAEDKLFGGVSKLRPGKITSPTRQRDTGQPSDGTERSPERKENIKSMPPRTNPDAVRLPSPQTSGSPPDHPTRLTFPQNVGEDGNQTAITGSRLSSLLFGDDDDANNEDALFGPLGGSRVAKGSGSGMTSRKSSLFGDLDNSPDNSSRFPARSRSLFDD